MTTAKTDLKKEYRELYTAPADRFVAVEVPRLRYLAVSGAGDPNSAPEYAQAVEALFSVAYTLKFFSKRELGRDYVVPPLEGLWWAEDWDAFVRRDLDLWQWTMLVLTPPWTTDEHVHTAIAAAGRKKSLVALPKLEVLALDEGTCLQTLHIGPYADEALTLRRLHQEHMPGAGLEPTGPHHEIYLSDPRKTEPHRLRTILRQPVRESKVDLAR